MIPGVKKIMDLSQPVYHGCPGWPTYQPTVVTYEARHVTHDFQAERIEMNVHTGTHVDAPYHFSPEGKMIDQMELEQFQGRGIVFDLRHIGQMAIEVRHLEACGKDLRQGDVALLFTGWAQKCGLNKEYVYQWPFITGEAARWLVDKGVKCVCIDGLSVGGCPGGSYMF